MKNGVLIDRELLETVIKCLKYAQYPINAHALEKAIADAPEAVIPIEKAHECKECPCVYWDGMNSVYCGTETVANKELKNFNPFVSYAAPHWCPQILKYDK